MSWFGRLKDRAHRRHMEHLQHEQAKHDLNHVIPSHHVGGFYRGHFVRHNFHPIPIKVPPFHPTQDLNRVRNLTTPAELSAHTTANQHNPHLNHAAIIGGGALVVMKLAGYGWPASAAVGAGVGLGSFEYMKKYGHSLPFVRNQ